MLRKIWNFFCSVKLTVVLFVLILIPSIIGTLIQQNVDPHKYEELYGPFWHGIFKFLGFYDVYHDWRFIILLVALGLNTFACTVNRFRPKWRMAGMLMTHFGLLLILLGGLAGAIFGVKGDMRIPEGQTLDTIEIQRAANSSTKPLGFQVKLIDFILEEHEEPIRKLVVSSVKAKRQERHSINEGKTISAFKPRWAKPAALLGIEAEPQALIHINKVIPNAVPKTVITEGPEQTGLAAVEFRLVGDTAESAFAFSQLDRPYLFPEKSIAVAYQKLPSQNLIDTQIRRAVSLMRPVNVIELTIPETGEKKTYPAEVGSKSRVEGTDYNVEVLRYVPDFLIDTATGQVTTRSQLPNNPAVRVRIDGPAGPQETWLFAKFPTMHAAGEAPPLSPVYIRSAGLGNIKDYVVLFKPDNAAPALVHVADSKVVSRKEVEIGKPVKIEGRNIEIVFEKFIENANMVTELVNDPTRPGGRPAVEITIEERGSFKPYYLYADSIADINGYRMLYLQQPRPSDFYSILQVIEDGQVVTEKKIEVNNPLRYSGYSFYQAYYDDRALSWSGLQVKKDPGIPLVYAGFVVQILGMIVIFYINPLLRKARKSQPAPA
jgi:hypothetical protein